MAKRKQERSVVEGNRWEASLSANRARVDVKDKKTEKMFTNLAIDEIDELGAIAMWMVDEMSAGGGIVVHLPGSAFRATVSPETGGTVVHPRGLSRVDGISQEDAAELGELSMSVLDMMVAA
jgi:hypothetical protein